jgi:hypothetical protein
MEVTDWPAEFVQMQECGSHLREAVVALVAGCRCYALRLSLTDAAENREGEAAKKTV